MNGGYLFLSVCQTQTALAHRSVEKTEQSKLN